ncbi:MAG: 50S ribosome-binding GTPase [Candidatus Zixiibacteriota bacterium]|nr:MAG: 50S ribosome-binding GTPase [candidate division Zixibacteria bacterium]
MPANLPPQYYELEREFKQETDLNEKLRLAKELLAMMPKHKGTDKLQADLKAKISKLKKQIDGGGKKHGARRADPHDHIDKEGAAQIILIGSPNSGKSSLVDALTHAKPLIGDYPYTTRDPLAGMMEFDTVQLQLIDTPPISEELFESYMPNLIRQADRVILVVDVSTPGLRSRIDVLISRLEEKRIILSPRIPDEIEDPRFAYKKTLIAAHKYLDENGDVGLAEIKKLYPEFTIVPTSILDDDSLEGFKKAVFESLEVIRVYTKKVGHEPDFVDPIILPIGGTVEDAAKSIHKDFAHNLQYAKIWGQGKFEGQRVKNSYVLSDKDVIEFHI